MSLRPLAIEGAFLYHSPVFEDSRGSFREWFNSEELADAGFEFYPVQSNLSQSARGVVRGIHYSLAPTGQAKWITCASGSIIDVVVDIRVDSQTYGQHLKIPLTAGDGQSVFIGPGLGHAFVALEDETCVAYLLSSRYAPTLEFGINPRDPDLSIDWPFADLILSPKDEHAPFLRSVPRELLPCI